MLINPIGANNYSVQKNPKPISPSFGMAERLGNDVAVGASDFYVRRRREAVEKAKAKGKTTGAGAIADRFEKKATDDIKSMRKAASKRYFPTNSVDRDFDIFVRMKDEDGKNMRFLMVDSEGGDSVPYVDDTGCAIPVYVDKNEEPILRRGQPITGNPVKMYLVGKAYHRGSEYTSPVHYSNGKPVEFVVSADEEGSRTPRKLMKTIHSQIDRYVKDRKKSMLAGEEKKIETNEKANEATIQDAMLQAQLMIGDQRIRHSAASLRDINQ